MLVLFRQPGPPGPAGGQSGLLDPRSLIVTDQPLKLPALILKPPVTAPPEAPKAAQPAVVPLHRRIPLVLVPTSKVFPPLISSRSVVANAVPPKPNVISMADATPRNHRFMQNLLFSEWHYGKCGLVKASSGPNR